MAAIDDWRAVAQQKSDEAKNKYIQSNQGLLNSINQTRDAELNSLATSNTQALNTLEDNKNIVNQTALDNAKAANVNRLLALKDNKSAMARAGLSTQGLVGSQVNSINNSYGSNLNTILKDKASGLRDIEKQVNNTNLTYETNKANLVAQYAKTLAEQQANINTTAQQLGTDAYNTYMSEQQKQAELEEQRRQADMQNALNWAQLRASQSSSSWGNDGSSGPQVSTAYYQGNYNADANNGVFSNGYQPDNVGGVKLKKSGNTITFKTQTLNGQSTTVTQNIWKAGKKYYYWDGRQNKYIQCDKKGNRK